MGFILSIPEGTGDLSEDDEEQLTSGNYSVIDLVGKLRCYHIDNIINLFIAFKDMVCDPDEPTAVCRIHVKLLPIRRRPEARLQTSRKRVPLILGSSRENFPDASVLVASLRPRTFYDHVTLGDASAPRRQTSSTQFPARARFLCLDLASMRRRLSWKQCLRCGRKARRPV